MFLHIIFTDASNAAIHSTYNMQYDMSWVSRRFISRQNMYT